MKRIKNRCKNEQGFALADLIVGVIIITFISIVMVGVVSPSILKETEENPKTTTETTEVSSDFYPTETE